MIKNIIIDLDETLVETDQARDRLFDFLVRKYFEGVDAERFRLSFRNHSLKEMGSFQGEPFMTYGINSNDLFFHRHLEDHIDAKAAEDMKYRILEDTFRDLNLSYQKELATQILSDLQERWLGYFEPIEGSREVLERLQKSGYRLYVLTDGFNEVQLPRVTQCGLDRFFDRVVASEELGIGKGSEEAFLRLMEQEGMIPLETIMIGDNIRTDYNAHKVGITALLFDRHDACKDKDVPCIRSLEEVFRFL
ncbi:MAG: HAD family hydrolase [Peptostreptococcaceae bacterium]|nr:HAD family hydrolase [Peptostreptococcaceae bacterium]